MSMNQDTGYIDVFYAGAPVEVRPSFGAEEGRMLGQAALDGAGVQLVLPTELRPTSEDEAARQREWREINERVDGHVKAIEFETMKLEGGQRISVGMLNHRRPDGTLRAGQENPWVIATSTITSSTETNPGNPLELSLLSALNPDLPTMLISSPGIGKTSPLSIDEQYDFAATGRMTRDGDGQAVPFELIQNLADELVRRDIHVRHLIGPSLGAVTATALGAALPNWQIENLIVQNPPELSTLPKLLMIGRYFWEGVRSRRAQRTTPDPWAITKDRIAHVRELRSGAGDMYAPHEGNRNMVQTVYSKVLALRKFMGKIGLVSNLASGLGNGIDGGWLRTNSTGKDPLFGDMSAFLTKQPAAKVTFVVGGQDPLNTRSWRPHTRTLLQRLSLDHPLASLRLFELPGMTHSFNTHYPQLVIAFFAKILGRQAAPTAAGQASILSEDMVFRAN